MSPQLNGEPRGDLLMTTESAADPTVPALGNNELERALPPAINTDRLSKTVVTRDTTLAPLFTAHAAADFRARWDIVQRSFVDDPAAAVQSADELVTQVTNALTETFARQRSTLEQSSEESKAPSTESSRLAIRHYRAFFERLLSL